MNPKFIAWRDDAVDTIRDLRKEKLLRIEFLTSGRNGFYEARDGQMVDVSAELVEKLKTEVAELEQLLGEVDEEPDP